MYQICCISTTSQHFTGILFSDNHNNLYFQENPNPLEESQFDVPHVVLNDPEDELKSVQQITGLGISFLINGESHVGFRNLLTGCKEIKKIISDNHGNPEAIATNAQSHGIKILAANYNIQQDNNSTMHNIAPAQHNNGQHNFYYPPQSSVNGLVYDNLNNYVNMECNIF